MDEAFVKIKDYCHARVNEARTGFPEEEMESPLAEVWEGKEDAYSLMENIIASGLHIVKVFDNFTANRNEARSMIKQQPGNVFYHSARVAAFEDVIVLITAYMTQYKYW